MSSSSLRKASNTGWTRDGLQASGLFGLRDILKRRVPLELRHLGSNLGSPQIVLKITPQYR